MRLAVIADIHGNALALEAVLADIDALGIENIVNLGDHFSGPLEAGRTAAILAGRPMLSVRGNHDRYLIEQAPEQMGKSDRCARDQLDDAAMDWLRNLPVTASFRDSVYLCHANPADDHHYWLESVADDGSVVPRAGAEIEQLAAGIRERLILCGHSHLQKTYRLADGRLIVNPGSVGCPAYDDDGPLYPAHKVEAGSPDARYAIASERAGDWEIEFRTVDYDHGAMADLALRRNRPEWARGLATGRL